MSEFEYLLIIVALLLSLAMARLIGGLPAALERSRRYWVHSVWVVSTIANVLFSWWMVYQYNTVSWNYYLFVLWLAPVALLLYVASLLTPTQANDVESWHDHFYGVRQRLMGANFLFSIAVMLFNAAALEETNPGNFLGPAPGAVLMAVGYRFENERVQGVVAVLQLVLIIGLSVVFSERPA
jgi:hypothetical protein